MLVIILAGVLCRILVLTGVFPLHLQHVRIPSYKFRGESALLECQYELAGGSYHRTRSRTESRGPRPRHDIFQEDYYNDEEESRGERIYSVKWYKDNEEFYRYIPSANPTIKSYKIEGIRVDPAHSDHSKVLLRSLTLKSSGVYRCEISAEAPSFDSVQGEGRMDVIYIPKEGPRISGDGDERSYHMGETLELNCTSGRSFPASTLQWYLNDQLVMDHNMLVSYPLFYNPHGLITTFLGLNVIMGPQYYENGVMRIKCVASLSPVLWREGKESILQWEQPTIDNREAMLLVKSTATNHRTSIGHHLTLLSAIYYFSILLMNLL
ncbi:uncharacterized protein LOC129775861 [Toxorhynchites rutilus septentrionalis]|uniref:uncharacterized protein LOC129775861 n=1 Tax=Toxorhynchites rutilus septentrionalis TaxID=329112 RepID=UPI002479BB04|nr:uncharacterized protein LOC129775861 [Toxorhynchites rutilus septentrionalis]